MLLPTLLSSNDKIEIILPSGKVVNLPVCRPKFSLWNGLPVSFDYGKKPLIDYAGEAVFAELVVLRTLIADGWDGVWVETYGGIHFLREMPKSWKLSPQNIDIPTEKRKVILEIQKLAKTSACFDTFAWKGDAFIFCEAKNKGKDRLTSGQLKFIEGALSLGISPESLLIVEWEIG